MMNQEQYDQNDDLYNNDSDGKIIDATGYENESPYTEYYCTNCQSQDFPEVPPKCNQCGQEMTMIDDMTTGVQTEYFN